MFYNCGVLCYSAIQRRENRYLLKNSHTFGKSYRANIRPILESDTTVSSPYKKKDVDLLESVENNFTPKMSCVAPRSNEFNPNVVQRRRIYSLPILLIRRKQNNLAFILLT